MVSLLRMSRRVALKLLKRLAMVASGGGALWWFFLRRPARKRELDQQSQIAAAAAKKKNVGLNKEFADQLRKILPVLFPRFWSRSTGLMAAHTTCLVARTIASIYLASMDGRIVKALITGNGKRFLSLLFVWLLSAVPIAFVNALIKYLKNRLAQDFRDKVKRLLFFSLSSSIIFFFSPKAHAQGSRGIFAWIDVLSARTA